jgi:TolB-like protein/Tfp pilus assembly protein PilF
VSLFNELKRRNVLKVGAAYIVIAWLVAQVLQLVFESFAAPDWVMKTVLVLLAAGVPFALLFAWIFELTPDGLKREHEVDRTQSITSQTSRKLDFVIISILVVALGYFVFDKFSGPPSSESSSGEVAGQSIEPGTNDPIAAMETRSQSIAVLPFINMSPDKDQEYFSDGISEEILNVLAKIPELHVTSRSSAFAFKGTKIDIPTVAKQLGVANVLEGSVRKSGNRVRITAQLIEAGSDRHLWSETYDRELDDIFAIQDEISLAIVTALKGHLDLEGPAGESITSRKTANTVAYQAYLRGHHLIVTRQRPALETALQEFQTAIELDPEFALAHAELAITYMLLINGQYGDFTFAEAQAQARPHADKAMELDPGLAEANAAAGFVLWNIGAPPETIAYFEEALRITPNHAQVLQWMSVAHAENGEYVKALQLEEQLAQLDPLSTANLGNLAMSYANRGRTESANSIVRNLSTLAPAAAHTTAGDVLWAQGKAAHGALEILRALQIEPKNSRPRLFLSYVFADMQLAAESLAIEQPPDSFAMWQIGRHQTTIETLNRKALEDPLTADDERWLGRAYAAAGAYDTALPLLEGVWLKSGHRVSMIGDFGHWDAVALIASRKAADLQADISDLLEGLGAHLQRMENAGITNSTGRILNQGLLAWYRGEVEAAFRAFETAASRSSLMPLNAKFLKALVDDPDFAPVIAARQSYIEREQLAFLDVVSWQPLPETCATHMQPQLNGGQK